MSDAGLDERGGLLVPQENDPDWRVNEARRKVREAWVNLGCAVLIRFDSPHVPPIPRRPTKEGIKKGQQVIWTRLPRQVVLEFYRADDQPSVDPSNQRAILVDRKPVLVLDGRCRWQEYSTGSGVFGTQKRGITFSAEGVPAKLDFSDEPGTASAISAVAGIPKNVAELLESFTKASDSLNSLRQKNLEYELARTKQEVELKEKQLAAAGLAATEVDFAKLESLKQQVEIIEKQKITSPTEPVKDKAAEDLNALRQSVEMAWLRQMLLQLGGSPEPQAPPDPSGTL